MKAAIERYRGSTSKFVLDHDFINSGSAEVDIDETGAYLISLQLEEGEELLGAKLNQIELNMSSWGNLVVLDAEDCEHPNYKNKTKPEEFIFCTFVNRAGRVVIEIQLKDEMHRVYCDVQPKYQNYLSWYEAVFFQFPLTKNPSSLGNASSIKSQLDAASFFPNRFDFLGELKSIISRMSSGLNRPGYLKKKYTLNSLDRGLTGRPDKALKMIRENKVTWKKAPLSSTSLARVGIHSFEPLVFARPKTESDFDNPDNRELLSAALEASGTLRQQANSLKEKNTYLHEIRSGRVSIFETKANILNEFSEDLHALADRLNQVSSKLSELGVRPSGAQFTRDPRYPQMQQDIDELRFWLSATVKKFGDGEVWTGQPDLSQLFEFFCYSQIIQAFENHGFKVSDRGNDTPVHFFVRMENKKSGTMITILYDQQIAGIDDISDLEYAPILCTLNNRPANGWFRPDFTIIMDRDGYSGFALLDAKYKSKNKARKDVSVLAAKYLTNLVGNSKDGKPCLYLGAMCLPEDDEEPEINSQMARDFSIGGSRETFFIHGYHPMSINENSLALLIPLLIEKFNRYFDLGLLDQTEQSGVPVKREVEQTTFLSSNTSSFQRKKGFNRFSKHFAPTVTEEMAAKIKGMLKRGDKPQDIAMFFGINNGRISEIKSETKFRNVPPLEDDLLPPPGPYPPPSSYI